MNTYILILIPVVKYIMHINMSTYAYKRTIYDTHRITDRSHAKAQSQNVNTP